MLLAGILSVLGASDLATSSSAAVDGKALVHAFLSKPPRDDQRLATASEARP